MVLRTNTFSSSLNGVVKPNRSAWAPRDTVCTLIPTASSIPLSTNLPPTTPIDPVIVAGSAEIVRPAQEM